MEQWYVQLFKDYGKTYENEPFVTGTAGECDFIEAEASFDRRTRILDIGCGTGRHSIELAKRGYRLTGVDLSESMLARAREKARDSGLEIDFRQGDARELSYDGEFDLAIMLCEGSFPLMETDEMNFRILENASRALTGNGKLIFTTLNGLFPLFHSVKDFIDAAAKEGQSSCVTSSFDLLTFRDYNITRAVDDSGNEMELHCNERYYVPPEITWLLKSAGFAKVGIYGARLGAFSRDHALTPDDFEMLVVAGKSATSK